VRFNLYFVGLILFASVAFAGPVEQVAVAEAFVWACQNQRPALEPDLFKASPPASVDGSGIGRADSPVSPLSASVEVSAVSKDTTGSGSGTVIECDGKTSKILTAAHIFDKLVDPEIAVAAAGKTWSATLLKIDRSVDLALLSVESSFPAVKVAKTIPADGTAVTSIGLGKAVKTRIISLDTYDKPAVFFCSTRESEGRSGGGLFANGELVGVIKAYVNGRATSLYVATDPIHDFLASPSIKSAPLFLPSSTEMRLEPISPIQAGPRSIPVAKFYTGEKKWGVGWCRNCPRYKSAYGDGNDKVRVEYTDEPLPEDDPIGLYPAVRFIGSDSKVKYPADKHGHYKIPETLDDLSDIVSRNAVDNTQYAATGPAGAIHAIPQIKQGFDWFREYIGEDRPVSVVIDRQEALINLLSTKDFDPKTIVGTNGRIEIECPQSNKIPVKSIGVNYHTVGSGLSVDADPFVIEHFLDNFGVKKSYGATSYGIIGIDDALFIYNCFEMFRDLISILHPHADLVLPAQISFTAVLRGDELTIDFDKYPSCRLTWLFQFNLGVKYVVVSLPKQNVHVDLVGSRWIKSRDFSLK